MEIAINDKSQGSAATCLMCGGTFDYLALITSAKSSLKEF